MKKPPTSHDPLFLNWPRRPNDPKNVSNNCLSYAAGDEDTQNNFADRDHPAIRQPDIGDNIGMPIKVFSLAHGFSAKTVCDLAERMGMTPVKVEPFDKLPEPPTGQRLVFMWFLSGARESNSMYHWGKIDPVNPDNPKGPRVVTHKMADEPPSMVDGHGHVITDPRYANFRANQEGPFFFFIPEKGLNLAMKPEWVEPIKQAYDHQKATTSDNVAPELADAFSTMAKLIPAGKDPVLDKFMQKVMARTSSTATLN